MPRTRAKSRNADREGRDRRCIFRAYAHSRKPKVDDAGVLAKEAATMGGIKYLTALAFLLAAPVPALSGDPLATAPGRKARPAFCGDTGRFAGALRHARRRQFLERDCPACGCRAAGAGRLHRLALRRRARQSALDGGGAERRCDAGRTQCRQSHAAARFQWRRQGRPALHVCPRLQASAWPRLP